MGIVFYENVVVADKFSGQRVKINNKTDDCYKNDMHPTRTNA
jgi:hypothetical protein